MTSPRLTSGVPRVTYDSEDFQFRTETGPTSIGTQPGLYIVEAICLTGNVNAHYNMYIRDEGTQTFNYRKIFLVTSPNPLFQVRLKQGESINLEHQTAGADFGYRFLYLEPEDPVTDEELFMADATPERTYEDDVRAAVLQELRRLGVGASGADDGDDQDDDLEYMDDDDDFGPGFPESDPVAPPDPVAPRSKARPADPSPPPVDPPEDTQD